MKSFDMAMCMGGKIVTPHPALYSEWSGYRMRVMGGIVVFNVSMDTGGPRLAYVADDAYTAQWHIMNDGEVCDDCGTLFDCSKSDLEMLACSIDMISSRLRSLEDLRIQNQIDIREAQ